MESLRSLIDHQTACVILEPIQTCVGIQISPPGYLKAVRELCDKFGVIMIVDENETRLGRTGSMFAIDTLGEGVIPDILTLGKPLSGGLMPISAAIYREAYLEFWDRNPFSHLSTFAGSDLSCVMGLATIDYIQKHHLVAQAHERGNQFAATCHHD